MKVAAQTENIGPVTDHPRRTDAEILRDLARAKAVFQLRALEAIIRGPAPTIQERTSWK